MSLRLVFMGTPDFAVVALDALQLAGHKICAVYTQPPRASGRGMALRKAPVHARADALGLPVFTPRDFKAREPRDAFIAHKCDFAVVAAYGLLLPQSILDAPRYGCWNIHASLLPRWRGAAPIQRALMAGDTETGISIMQMETGLDTGAVLDAQAIPISPRDTAETLHRRLAELGAARICDTLARFEDGTLAPPQAQDDAQATYAKKITKAEARIDWTRDAESVSRQIRALAPSPGAWCETENGTRLKILDAALADMHSTTSVAGEIVSPAPHIACGRGGLRLLKLQYAGRAALPADAFQRGKGLRVGTRLL